MQAKHFILFVLLIASSVLSKLSGQNIGIGTLFPQRSLEVYSGLSQFARIHSSNTIGGEAALELVLGGEGIGQDYKISNDAGTFRLMSGVDNFTTDGQEIWRINYEGHLGMGTTLPDTRLHIVTGEEASNTGDGHLIIGAKSGINIVMDGNEILARNNGSAYSLTLQSHGGATHLSSGGGNTFFGTGGGNLGIGTSSVNHRLNVANGTSPQIAFRNPTDGLNDWFIGASNPNWIVGDDMLVFSPSNASNDAVLRLKDLTDNNGTEAPVMIRSSASQTLLLDGNEIDSKDGALHINGNSGEETYINPSGGWVGVGTDAISTTLQIKATSDVKALRLQKNDVFWDISPSSAFDYLGFIKDGWTVGRVDGSTGQWITLSDRNAKEDITPLEDLLDKLLQVQTYTYNFLDSDPSKPIIGILAQELQPLFPELVSERDGHFTVAHSKLSILLLKAIQEQQKIIGALENELNQLLSGSSTLMSSK